MVYCLRNIRRKRVILSGETVMDKYVIGVDAIVRI